MLKNICFATLWLSVVISCTEENKKKEYQISRRSASQTYINMQPNKITAIQCKLTTAELAERKKTVLKVLDLKSREKIDLPNGMSYLFNYSSETVDLLTEFIKTEKECCDFFDIDLSIESNNRIWLSITGPEGAKDFIEAELEN